MATAAIFFFFALLINCVCCSKVHQLPPLPRNFSNLLIAWFEVLGNKNSPSLLSTSTFQDSDLLTFNISAHHSWWGEHGPGCVRKEMPQAAGVRATESQSYITVMGCLLDYQYIEVAHSGAQILVAVSTCEKNAPHVHEHANRELITLRAYPREQPTPPHRLFPPRSGHRCQYSVRRSLSTGFRY